MVDPTNDPDQQSGTGEPRSDSGPGTSLDDEQVRDTRQPPDEIEVRQGINRSGSGGTGGPAEGDQGEDRAV